jgi:hypothetical protein
LDYTFHNLKDGRNLFVINAYMDGSSSRAKSRLLKFMNRSINAIIQRSPLRVFLNHHFWVRQAFANPRDLNYLLGLIRSFVKEHDLSGPNDVIVDDRLEPGEPVGCDDSIRHVKIVSLSSPESWQDGTLSKLRAGLYDSAFLVFPDALGLGCEWIEDAVSSAPVRNIFVINGRRRVFPLDRRMSRSVAWHRLLARTQIVESVLALLVIPMSLGCALIDFLQARAGWLRK